MSFPRRRKSDLAFGNTIDQVYLRVEIWLPPELDFVSHEDRLDAVSNAYDNFVLLHREVAKHDHYRRFTRRDDMPVSIFADHRMRLGFETDSKMDRIPLYQEIRSTGRAIADHIATMFDPELFALALQREGLSIDTPGGDEWKAILGQLDEDPPSEEFDLGHIREIPSGTRRAIAAIAQQRRR